MKKSRKNSLIAIVLVILVFVFMSIAAGFNSDWGKVEITDIYYPNSEGTMIHAQLFVPDGVSSSNPAPAILNMHGGSDYLQMVGNYSIELARRGYVVLSVDAYGSGSSDYVSGVASNAGGSGGENTALKMDGGVSTGIEQLLIYDFVDHDNIGMIGHSMGGTYVANAALEYAEHIKAIMPWGSGSFVDMMKASDPADFTFNVGYINAKCDEMVYFATGAPSSALLGDDLLKNFFGTTETIEAGKVYGSFEEGTARVIYTPNTTHVGNIINRTSIGSMLAFFEQAIPTGSTLSSSDHVWMLKEAFCILGIVALVAFAIFTGFALLEKPVFSLACTNADRPAISTGKGLKVVGIVLCIVVPILTLHQAGLRLAGISPNSLFPMNWANSLAGLAVVNAVILLVVFLLWHFLYAKKQGAGLAAYGFTDTDGKLNGRMILWSAVLAITLVVAVYAVVNLCYGIFKIDFRFWQFGIMPITLDRAKHLLGYLLCYLFAFGVMNTISVVFADIGAKGGKGTAVKQYVLGWLIGAGGYLIVLVIYYVGLKTTQAPPFFFGYPPFANGHPNSLVFSMKTLCLVPTFTVLSVINTALYRKSKNIYVGWFVAALMAALIVITTNAFAR